MSLSRRVGALLIAVACLIPLAACGGSDDSAATDTDPSTTPVTDGEGVTDDSSDPTAAEATTTTTPPPDDGAVYPGDEWATATPEEVGLDPAPLDELTTYLQGTQSNCVSVVKDGLMVVNEQFKGEPLETEQEIYSATKSVTAILVGIAQDQGFLDIEQPASDFITEWQGTDSESVTVRNLLSNDSGRYYDFQTDYLKMSTADNRTEFAIALDQQHPPGEHWEYNNSAIQTLQAVLERSTEQDMTAFADESLFGPLGMASQFNTDRSGTEAAFFGLQASCQDMARFGYMILQGGMWDGQQIVSEEYVDEATSPSQDLNPAYGFLWWLNEKNGMLPVVNVVNPEMAWPDAPEDAFSAVGAGDQYILVLPSQNMVVTRTGPSNIVAMLAGGSDDVEPVPSTSANEIGRLAAAAGD